MLTCNPAAFFEEGASIAISTTFFRGKTYADRFDVITASERFQVVIVRETWKEMEYYTLKFLKQLKTIDINDIIMGDNIIKLDDLRDISLSVNEMYGDDLGKISVRRIAISSITGTVVLRADEDEGLPGEFLVDRL